MNTNIYQHKPLQVPMDAPQVCSSTAPAKSGVSSEDETKRNAACRSGNTLDSERSIVGKHTVFVLSSEGKPLTPTTPTKARKLLRDVKAEKVWSKFNTFGIKLKDKTREEIPKTTLGVDYGTKFEGYSVVCCNENNLSVKLDLPNKDKIVRKIKERREARRTRRSRLRRRQPRFKNRSRKGFIAPSQLVIVNSRLKIIRELCSIYPITEVAIEDIKFNHKKYRWGRNFSTMEIGKNKIRQWFKDRNISITEFKGNETKKLRQKYGYGKCYDKSANVFESHCCDSLSLALEINNQERLEPNLFLVVDDTYRCVRRKIHDSNLKKDGVRGKYSKGTVFGLKKGLMVGTRIGESGQLCGCWYNRFGIRNKFSKRKWSVKLLWINNQFNMENIHKR